MKKQLLIVLILALIIGIIGNSNSDRKTEKKTSNRKTSEKAVNLSNYEGVKKISIFVQGFESGPAVTKLILQMGDYRITNLDKNNWKVRTNGF